MVGSRKTRVSVLQKKIILDYNGVLCGGFFFRNKQLKIEILSVP